MREALKLALEAFDDRSSLTKWQAARDAVKEALAQPEQKIYGYVRADGQGIFIYGEHQFQNTQGVELIPVYTEPPEPKEQERPQNCGTGYCSCIECVMEPEPVSWESILGAVARGWCYEENANKTMDSELAVAIAKEVQALCTTPPQRTWVGLTPEEIDSLANLKVDGAYLSVPDTIRQTDAKLKEKNT